MFNKAKLEKQLMAEIKDYAHVVDFPWDDAKEIAAFVNAYNKGNEFIFMASMVAAPTLEKYPDLYNNWDNILKKYKKLGLFPKWNVLFLNDEDDEELDSSDTNECIEIEDDEDKFESMNTDEKEEQVDVSKEEMIEIKPSKINQIQIDKLGSLLDDGVISQLEYNEKIASMVGYTNRQEGTKSSIAEKKSTGKGLLIAMIFCAVFGVFGYACGDIFGGSMYKDDIVNYYLDNAVFVIDNDDSYYHRYGCPDTPMDIDSEEEYEYEIYDPEHASNLGYKQCPTCFELDQSDYVDSYVY